MTFRLAAAGSCDSPPPDLEIGFGRAVSRILSAPLRMERIICLCSRYPESVSLSRNTGAGRSGIPYLALHPMGFSVPRRLRVARWLLPHLFTLTRVSCETPGGLIFCGTVRRKVFQLSARVYPSRTEPELRGIAPFGVRTFLPRPAVRDGSDSPPFQNHGII